ncbi:MAG: lipid-binding SYLF domain-containing protein [Marinibacterium sp.]|nr:lipid-binding SYLF domain-containing protein [Marinibacterium sp.]
MTRDTSPRWTRRAFGTGVLAATGALAACGNGVNSRGSETIDARADATLNLMFNAYPNTIDLSRKAAGMLVMPLVSEAGFGLGGSYGRGALRIDGATVDYYSQTSASAGFQIGAQQYASVLFFMTEAALAEFRAGSGWTAGGDIGFVVSNDGASVAADTNTLLSDVLAAVFNQAGLYAGASLAGTKYTRIIP